MKRRQVEKLRGNVFTLVETLSEGEISEALIQRIDKVRLGNLKFCFPDNSTRYEELARPKKRIDKTRNYNAFNVKRGALSYQITDTLNKLAQPKRKPESNASSSSNFNENNGSTNTVKQGRHKLINSNEQSKDAQESKKKKFLLDTYARITATRNRGCSKRLHELAKPKNFTGKNEGYEDFDTYFQTIKKYNAKNSYPKRK